ncbi:amino acid permease [Streptomyces eurocidicus]|uniref:Amino acid permease n=1 Tax=Streptomyces eurocidicus TaxID=66423 RepID=A0A2N8NRL9_STREU|nr:APC family permease [Streptomyces eurocidicus]MBB5117241.1 amino acid transporter [Streptomyces eurocidicus]MBF6052469.1 amino acid permease [Streptomyces eurocidicus]PNE31419.1 amino acid permease [Streptomyces eurocidicus]
MAQPAGEVGSTRLHRTLTFRDLVVYGLLFIAPMAPVGIFGTLDAKSHGAVALVYVVATVAMAFTAFSYAQMVRVAPQAGSVYTYARVGLGEGPGFIAGWMAMLDYLLIPAVAYLFSGIAMNALVPEVSRWVWTAIAVVVTTGLNLWGVRAAALVGFLVLALEIVVLLVFLASAVFALAEKGTRRGWLSPLTGEGGLTTGAVFTAVSVAVLSYLGFDAIAAFAEESAGGSARVARAVLTCLAVAGVLFVAQTYLAALLAPMSPAELAADPAGQGSAFYDTVDAATGAWLHDLVAASKAIGAAFAALAGQAAAGWLLFAMARDRRLPGLLAKVDRGSGVPRPALLGAAAVTLVAAVWAARRDDGLDRLVSVVDVGALIAFALLHLSVIGWFAVRRRGGPTRPVRHVVVPLLGLAVVIAVVVRAATTAQVVGGVWLVVGLGVLIAQRVRGRPVGAG